MFRTALRSSLHKPYAFDLWRCSSSPNFIFRGQLTTYELQPKNLTGLRTIATRSNDQNSIDQTSTTSTQPISITQALKNAENLSSLLKVINSINNLTFYHLESIFDRIIGLCLKPEHKLNFIDLKSAYKNFDELNKSPVYNVLINRATKEIISRNVGNSKFKLNVLRVFSLTDVHPESDSVNLILNSLNGQLSSLNMSELVEYQQILITFQQKIGDQNFRSKQFDKILQLAENKLLKNQFDRTDNETLIKNLHIFLISNYKEAAGYLIKQLSRSNRPLDYSQAVNLLFILKQAIKMTQLMINESHRSNLNHLIDKCNKKIIEQLIKHQTYENASLYIKWMGRNVDEFEINVANYYPPKLLELLNPISMNRNQEPEIKLFTFNVILNFSKFNVFDERILKYLYELVCEDKILRTKRGIGIFLLFCRFKFPFIDYRNLADLLLIKNSNQINNLIANDYINGLRLICVFLLSDTNCEKLLDHLNHLKLQSHKSSSSKQLSPQLSNLVSLSKVHLSLLSETDTYLKRKIEKELTILQSSIKIKKQIKTDLLKIENKLQENGYLDEVCLHEFAIYDKLSKSLVSLTNYRNYFHRLHQIPLDKNHELLTFIQQNTLSGQIQQYDSYFNYVLKKILGKFNIKTIDVDITNFNDLPVEKAAYLVNRALDCYK